MQEVKPIWQSKTVWVNLILALSAFIPGVGHFVRANPESVMAIFSVINVILRLVTKDKVQIA